MKKFKKIMQKKSEGKLVYGDGIVEDIVRLAVSELEDIELAGSLNRKGGAIKVFLDKDVITVDVSIRINYTQSVSEMAFKVQEAIRHNVEAVTEYRVVAVNVNVNGIMFNDGVSPKPVEENNAQSQPKEKAKTTNKPKKAKEKTTEKAN